MDFLKSFLLKNEISNEKLRVKIKTAIFAAVTAAIFFTVLFGAVYFLGFNMFRNRGIESQAEMARILAAAVDSSIEKESDLLKLNANNQIVIDSLKTENLKYRGMSEKEIQLYLVEMNKKWGQSAKESSLASDYLENKLSHRLSELKLKGKKLIALTVADKFGGLVGATTKPEKFYDYDQDWWLSSYAKGRGKPYIGNVEFDEASNLWCLPFAAAVEDENGVVIGVYKALISLEVFFKPLLNFKIGDTGRTALVDDRAYLIYHNESTPFTNKYCEYEELQKTLQNRDKWGIIESAYLNRGKSLVAFSELSHPALSAKRTQWYVFVERDLSEIFAPLDKFILLAILFGMAIILTLVTFVFICSGQEHLCYSMFHLDKGTTVTKTEDKNYHQVETKAQRLTEKK